MMTATLCLVSCASTSGSDVVATWRGGSVDRATWQSWLYHRGLDDLPETRLGYLEEMLTTIVLAQSAQAHALPDGPVVRSELEIAENRVLATALSRRVVSAVVVEDAEVEELLRENPAAFHKPRRLRLRNITKRIPVGASDDERAAVRSAMEGIRERVLDGESFADIARAESDSQTRFQGGAMGLVRPGDLAPELERVAFGLVPGEVTPVLQTSLGFVLLRCDAVFEAVVPTREEQLRKIRENLTRLRANEALEKVGNAVTEEWPPTVAEDGVLRCGDHPVVSGNPAGGLRVSTASQWCLQFGLAAEARRAGLGDDAGVRAEIAWSRRDVLALHEIARRAQEKLRPVTREEALEEYTAHPGRYHEADAVRVSGFRVSFDRNTALEIDRRVEEAYAGIVADELTMEEAAAGVDGAILINGDRWYTGVEIAAWGPNPSRTLSELTVGEVARPVRQDSELMVLRLEERRPSRQRPFDEVEEGIRARLGGKQLAEIRQGIESEVRRGLGIAAP